MHDSLGPKQGFSKGFSSFNISKHLALLTCELRDLPIGAGAEQKDISHPNVELISLRKFAYYSSSMVGMLLLAIVTQITILMANKYSCLFVINS